MPTEEELEERIADFIDRGQRMVRDAILKLEIENLEKAVKQCENVSGFSGVQGKGTGA